VIPRVDIDNAAWFHALLRLPNCWKVSNNPQTTTTTLEDWHGVVRITKRSEQAIMMGKIKGSAKGFQNNDERWIRRWPWRWETLVMWSSQVVLCLCCSNVFAKIDIPLLLEFVYQYLSGPRLGALTPPNPMQPLFPMWYNPSKRFEYHRGI